MTVAWAFLFCTVLVVHCAVASGALPLSDAPRATSLQFLDNTPNVISNVWAFLLFSSFFFSLSNFFVTITLWVMNYAVNLFWPTAQRIFTIEYNLMSVVQSHWKPCGDSSGIWRLKISRVYVQTDSLLVFLELL